MIKEIVLKDFPNWDPEKQLSEYQGYKAMGDYSPFSEEDYKLMETVMNNHNAEVQCEDGVCKIINEIPDKGVGNWNFNEFSTEPQEISYESFSDGEYFIKKYNGKYYNILWDNFNTWYLILNDNGKYYIIGYLKLIKYNSLPNAMQVDGIEIHKNFRNKGLSTFLYRAIKSKKGYSIVSDYIQYDNARKIWASLAKKDGVKIYDEETGKKSNFVSISDYNDNAIWGANHTKKLLVFESYTLKNKINGEKTLKEQILESFSDWDPEKQISEYQSYKAMGDYSPFGEEDYKLMETIMNNHNAEISIECENGTCEIVSDLVENEEIEEYVRLDESNISKDDFKKAIKVISDDLKKLESKIPELEPVVSEIRKEASKVTDFLLKSNNISVDNVENKIEQTEKNFILISDGTISFRTGNNIRGQHKKSDEINNILSSDLVHTNSKQKAGKFTDFTRAGSFYEHIMKLVKVSESGDMELKLRKDDKIKIFQSFLFSNIIGSKQEEQLLALDSNNTEFFEFFQSIGFVEDKVPTDEDSLNRIVKKAKQFKISISAKDTKKLFKHINVIQSLMQGSINAYKKYIAEFIPRSEIHFIYGEDLKKYYSYLINIENLDKKTWTKTNTADVVIADSPKLLSTLKSQKHELSVIKNTPIIEIDGIRFVQVSLKANENAQYGKTTSYLRGALNSDGLDTILRNIVESEEDVFYENETLNEFIKFNDILATMKKIMNSVKNIAKKISKKITTIFSKFEKKINTFIKHQDEIKEDIYKQLLVESKLYESDDKIFENRKNLTKEFFSKFEDNHDIIIAKAVKIINTKTRELMNKTKTITGIDMYLENKKTLLESNDKNTIIKLVANIAGLNLLDDLIKSFTKNDSKQINDEFVEFFATLDAQSKTGATNLPILKVYGGNKDSEILINKNIKKNTGDNLKNSLINASKIAENISPIIIKMNKVSGQIYFSLNLYYMVSFNDNGENPSFEYMNMQLRSNSSGKFTFTAENSRVLPLSSIIHQ